MTAIIHAIILGIIEGFTEFLPISSTGHLIVAEHAIGFKDMAELFTVVIQIGSVSAVIWYYRLDIIGRITGLFKRESNAGKFWVNLIIATIPAGLIGVALDKTLQKYANPRTVAISLILGGIVLWLVETYHQTDKAERPRRMEKQIDARLDTITPKQALGVGVAQVVSLVPGVSRSGATIVGGLLSGLDRVTATSFSFYLSIPVMILATLYKVGKNHAQISQLPGGTAALVVGVVTAFITGLMAVSWLLSYVSKHDFKNFAYYRIGFGFVVLFLLGIGFLG
ncbi:MAG: undecaprenyl-diphosphate phosphatase [Candidatus Saccharibacteria bacterium]|nr:undecaprenyl-diphosphate phosphatase [Candidatus Saccharibacteria bacterium]